MKLKIEFWNRNAGQQDEVIAEIDKSSDGFLKKMAEMRLRDSSTGLIGRTIDWIMAEVSKGETVHKVTRMS
jgi:hypothetical protein